MVVGECRRTNYACSQKGEVIARCARRRTWTSGWQRKNGNPVSYALILNPLENQALPS